MSSKYEEVLQKLESYKQKNLKSQTNAETVDVNLNKKKKSLPKGQAVDKNPSRKSTTKVHVTGGRNLENVKPTSQVQLAQENKHIINELPMRDQLEKWRQEKKEKEQATSRKRKVLMPLGQANRTDRENKKLKVDAKNPVQTKKSDSARTSSYSKDQGVNKRQSSRLQNTLHKKPRQSLESKDSKYPTALPTTKLQPKKSGTAYSKNQGVNKKQPNRLQNSSHKKPEHSPETKSSKQPTAMSSAALRLLSQPKKSDSVRSSAYSKNEGVNKRQPCKLQNALHKKPQQSLESKHSKHPKALSAVELRKQYSQNLKKRIAKTKSLKSSVCLAMKKGEKDTDEHEGGNSGAFVSSVEVHTSTINNKVESETASPMQIPFSNINNVNSRRDSYTLENSSVHLDIPDCTTSIGRRGSYTVEDGSSFIDWSQHKDEDMCQTSKREFNKILVRNSPHPRAIVTQLPRRSVRFKSPEFLTLDRKGVTRTPNRFGTPKKEMSQRENLDAWLTSRGRTPTAFRHLHSFGDHLSAKKKAKSNGRKSSEAPASILKVFSQPQITLDELDVLVTHVSDDKPQKTTESVIKLELCSILDECSTLFEAGCPVEAVMPWLDNIKDTIPEAVQSARFWVVQAHVMEDYANDSAVLGIFEEAVRNRATPPEEVAHALKGFVERMTARQQAVKYAAHTPARKSTEARMKSEVEPENMFQSSAIKYMYTDTTPFFKRIRSSGTLYEVDSPCAVVTPVRRSTRRSLASLPKMLQEHDLLVDDLSDLDAVKKENSLYKNNKALFEDTSE